MRSINTQQQQQQKAHWFLNKSTINGADFTLDNSSSLAGWMSLRGWFASVDVTTPGNMKPSLVFQSCLERACSFFSSLSVDTGTTVAELYFGQYVYLASGS